MSRGLRREALGFAINVLDTTADVAALISAACTNACERLCERLDLIPSGVQQRANLGKEIR